MCLKLHLAHDPVLNDILGERGKTLAAKMSILINGQPLSDNSRLKEAIPIGTTAHDLHSNEITIEIEGKAVLITYQDKTKKLQHKNNNVTFHLRK